MTLNVLVNRRYGSSVQPALAGDCSTTCMDNPYRKSGKVRPKL